MVLTQFLRVFVPVNTWWARPLLSLSFLEFLSFKLSPEWSIMLRWCYSRAFLAQGSKLFHITSSNTIPQALDQHSQACHRNGPISLYPILCISFFFSLRWQKKLNKKQLMGEGLTIWGSSHHGVEIMVEWNGDIWSLFICNQEAKSNECWCLLLSQELMVLEWCCLHLGYLFSLQLA